MALDLSSNSWLLPAISISRGHSVFTTRLVPWEFGTENAKLWYSIASWDEEYPSWTIWCSCIAGFSTGIHTCWGWAGSFTWGGMAFSVTAGHWILSPLSFPKLSWPPKVGLSDFSLSRHLLLVQQGFAPMGPWSLKNYFKYVCQEINCGLWIKDAWIFCVKWYACMQMKYQCMEFSFFRYAKIMQCTYD